MFFCFSKIFFWSYFCSRFLIYLFIFLFQICPFLGITKLNYTLIISHIKQKIKLIRDYKSRTHYKPGETGAVSGEREEVSGVLPPPFSPPGIGVGSLAGKGVSAPLPSPAVVGGVGTGADC